MIAYQSKRPHLSGFCELVLAGVEEECERHNLSRSYGRVEVDEFQSIVNWTAKSTVDTSDRLIIVGASLDAEIAAAGRSGQAHFDQ